MDGSCQYGTFPLPESASWLVDAVAALNSSYAAMHPSIAVFLCVAGTVMNMITVAVLTRPTMLSPVNVLLCAVACCDIAVMSFLFIFVVHFLIAAPTRCDAADYGYAWALFLFLHAQATVVLHATSIWLTVLLAQIRVLTIRRATRANTEAVSARACAAIAVCTLVVVAAVNVPSIMTFKIITVAAELWLPCLAGNGAGGEETPLSLLSAAIVAGNESAVDVDAAVLPVVLDDQDYGVIYHLQASSDDCALLKLAFWTNGLLFKVVPCALLTLSIVALLKIIAEVADRRRHLGQGLNKQRRVSRDHTTPMLVAVLSIFLVAELPQGVLHVCNAIFSNETFYQKIYLPLGDLLDLLSLVNSAVNFIIYCAMSRKFRVVFLELMRPCVPSFFTSRFLDVADGADFEASRHRPSGVSDLTRTEQLALASSQHRPSTTSMLLRAPSKENKEKPSHDTLLVVPGAPRVSFDQRTKSSDGGRNSIDIHELRLKVPSTSPSPSSRSQHIHGLLASAASLVEEIRERARHALRLKHRRLPSLQRSDGEKAACDDKREGDVRPRGAPASVDEGFSPEARRLCIMHVEANGV